MDGHLGVQELLFDLPHRRWGGVGHVNSLSCPLGLLGLTEGRARCYPVAQAERLEAEGILTLSVPQLVSLRGSLQSQEAFSWIMLP